MLTLSRTKILSAALAVAFTLTSGAVAFADQRGGRGFHGRGHHGAMFAEQLGLTDDQKSRIKAIREQNSEAMRAAHEDVRAKREALEDALSAATVDQGLVDARIRELSAAQEAMMRQSVSLRRQIAEVLTAEQRAQIQTMREQHKQRREERRQQFQLRRRERGAQQPTT